jgi:uncharacterized protein with gpF-like domain
MTTRQPFDEAIAYLLEKLAIPTDSWEVLSGEINDYAFGIAGVTDAAILEDVQIALLEALQNGTDLRVFRAEFQAIMAKRGWAGVEPWRVNLIYQQNLRTAYAAGRWQQMTDPDVLMRRPYWMWRHRDSRNPRLHHLAMDGRVFLAQDAIAQGINFPLGFGCKCTWLTLGERDLTRLGLQPEPFPQERIQLRDRITGNIQSVPAIRVVREDGSSKLEPIVDPGFMWATGSTPASERRRVLTEAVARIRDPQLKVIVAGRVA